DEGFLPEAVTTFVASLGWSGNPNLDPLTMDEFVERFSLSQVGTSPAAVSYEQLHTLNKRVLRRALAATAPPAAAKKQDDCGAPTAVVDGTVAGLNEAERAVRDDVAARLRETGVDPDGTRLGDVEYFRAALALVQTKARTVPEASRMLVPFFHRGAAAPAADAGVTALTDAAASALAGAAAWDAAGVRAALNAAAAAAAGGKFGRVMRAVRAAVAGSEVGPDLVATLVALGREEVLARLRPVGPASATPAGAGGGSDEK
ncbi:Glutamate--tRNA ligase mitochondrial, partial [Cladochytrium tenue]